MNLNAFDYLILLKRGSKKRPHEYLITACKKNPDLTHAGIVCKEIKSRVNKFGRKRE